MRNWRSERREFCRIQVDGGRAGFIAEYSICMMLVITSALQIGYKSHAGNTSALTWPVVNTVVKSRIECGTRFLMRQMAALRPTQSNCRPDRSEFIIDDIQWQLAKYPSRCHAACSCAPPPVNHDNEQHVNYCRLERVPRSLHGHCARTSSASHSSALVTQHITRDYWA